MMSDSPVEWSFRFANDPTGISNDALLEQEFDGEHLHLSVICGLPWFHAEASWKSLRSFPLL